MQALSHYICDLIPIHVEYNGYGNDEKDAHSWRKHEERNREKRCGRDKAHYDNLDKAGGKARMSFTSRARFVAAKGEEVFRLVKEPLLYLGNRGILFHPRSVMMDV
jgi:hypothetical protein